MLISLAANYQENVHTARVHVTEIASVIWYRAPSSAPLSLDIQTGAPVQQDEVDKSHSSETLSMFASLWYSPGEMDTGSWLPG